MSTGTKRRYVFLIIGVVVLAFGGLLFYWLNGNNLSIRSLARSVKHVILVTLDRNSISSSRKGPYTDIIFLHHSVGQNLIAQGGVRGAFSEAGYSLWDQDYNLTGISDPAGNLKGYSYNIPGDNTDIDGLAQLFSQTVYPYPFNAFSSLLQHEVIIFKSCYPNNDIKSDEQLALNKQRYIQIRDAIDRHPDKLFILLTTPPLNPAESNSEDAARARKLALWLISDEFLGNRANFFVFDFYTYLAEENPGSPDYNMLRNEYRDGTDSHPNRIANETIGPEFVRFVVATVEKYRGD